MTEEKKLRSSPNTKLTPEQIAMRAEVKRIANRVHASTSVTMVDLARPLNASKMYIWHLLRVESVNHWPITLDTILVWARDPETQEFARRLLFEMLSHVDAHMDVSQLRLTDLQRFGDSPFPIHNQIAVNVVRDLAERYGLIPANTTNTAEAPIALVK